jgi:hypothetical protein
MKVPSASNCVQGDLSELERGHVRGQFRGELAHLDRAIGAERLHADWAVGGLRQAGGRPGASGDDVQVVQPPREETRAEERGRVEAVEPLRVVDAAGDRARAHELALANGERGIEAGGMATVHPVGVVGEERMADAVRHCRARRAEHRDDERGHGQDERKLRAHSLSSRVDSPRPPPRSRPTRGNGIPNKKRGPPVRPPPKNRSGMTPSGGAPP